MLPRLCNISFHTSSHSTDEVILHPEAFLELNPGDLIQIWDPETPSNRLFVKVPNKNNKPSLSRIEISILKALSDAAGFKQFGRVVVDRASEDEASLDFVELSFRRQYLQRSNMLRFKTSFIGRTVYMNQSLNIDSVQAQIQDLRTGALKSISGLITDSTKFVFRSKSARVIWLVQISAEMWDFDMSGDIYFEKFLKEFVSPVFDSWRALGVSHMLTVIFFARTFYLDRISQKTHPDLYAKKSFTKNSSGFYQQDYFQIVIENVLDYDKITHIKNLRQQFWEFAQRIGWKACKDPEKDFASRLAVGSNLSVEETEESSKGLKSNTKSSVHYAVPSDAVHGNVLESINATLNILDKHYMDRDLSRTGNSIVLISVGSGLFKVKPNLAQITKQRMLDSAFGIDYISLSRPPVHVVPLFLVDCKAEASGMTDFYEMPHWIRVSYVDNKNKEKREFGDDEQVLSGLFSPPPVSSTITATIMHAEDLRSLVIGYINALPLSLRQTISLDSLVSDEMSHNPSFNRLDNNLESALNMKPALESAACCSIPEWGIDKRNTFAANRRAGEGFSSKSTFYQRDLLNVKAVAMSRSPLFNKKLYTEIFESLPAMHHERDNMVAESYSSRDEAMSKSYEQNSLDSYMQQHEGHLNLFAEKTVLAMSKLPIDKQKLLENTFMIMKLRNNAFLSENTSIESLEEIFFQHDAALFKINVNAGESGVQESKPEPIVNTSVKEQMDGSGKQMTARMLPQVSPGPIHEISRTQINKTSNAIDQSIISSVNSNTLATPELSSTVAQQQIEPKASQARGPMNSRDLWLRNRHQHQLAQRNLETKKALMNASKPNTTGTTVVKKGVSTLDYLQDYCKTYGINPFKQKEGKKYLSQMSHNRRRWSHVFPLGKSTIDLGLNWKSLTQPAILPLNTDYLPGVGDLKEKFEVSTYTIQFMAADSPFNTLEDALKELVCQRLTHEFQLIEGRDQSPYMRFNNKYTLANRENFFILTMGHRIQFLYGDPATSEISISQYISKKGKNNDVKPDGKEGEDKTSFTYRYEMWMPQLQRFETIVQSFHQFPTPELKWNLVDNVIVGGDSFDGSIDGLKTRRLRYMIIPYNISTTKDIESYYEQIDMLLDYFRKSLAKDAKIEVTKDTSVSVNEFQQLERVYGCITTNRFSSIYRQCQRQYNTARLYMRGPKHSNPNWLFLKYERNIYSFKAFHFELHWNVCDSWLIEDYINLLYRRCSRWGLRLVQTPEYFTTSNLSVHPFKALPYIQLQEAIRRVPNSHSSTMRVIERLIFGRSQGWIFDSEQTTDWSNVGISPPNYNDRDRDFAFEAEGLPGSAGEGSSQSSIMNPTTGNSGVFSALTRTLRMVFKKSDDAIDIPNTSASDSPSLTDMQSSAFPSIGMQGMFGSKSSNVKLDRQYVHISGLAVVRMAGNGFVWMQNATARLSESTPIALRTTTSCPADLTSLIPSRDEQSVVIPGGDQPVRSLLSLQGAHATPTIIEERRNQTLLMMRSLEQYMPLITFCHEIVIDMVKVAMKTSEDKAAMEKAEQDVGIGALSVQVSSSRDEQDLPRLPSLTSRPFSSETTQLTVSISTSNYDTPPSSAPSNSVSHSAFTSPTAHPPDRVDSPRKTPSERVKALL